VKFIDEAIITVQSGNGGAGCVSFRREKFIPRGGPDGGDGGRGGDILIRSTAPRHTLSDFRFRRHFKAEDGRPGQKRQKAGRSGAALVIEIPPGTLVTDADTGEVLKDFAGSDETAVICRGGRGGRGNRHFRSASHQAPRFAQPGEAGESRTLRLDLKLIADVGIVGLPNAGKSTLIRALTAARPKTGPYPFTTLVPHLGVLRIGAGEPVFLADIPGLIEGAHQGAGLGTRFLRHIERTRVLLHLIDASAISPGEPLADYRTLREEMGLYRGELLEKPSLIVLNKMDLPRAAENADRFRKALPGAAVWGVSALRGDGMADLIEALGSQLEAVGA